MGRNACSRHAINRILCCRIYLEGELYNRSSRRALRLDPGIQAQTLNGYKPDASMRLHGPRDRKAMNCLSYGDWIQMPQDLARRFRYRFLTLVNDPYPFQIVRRSSPHLHFCNREAEFFRVIIEIYPVSAFQVLVGFSYFQGVCLEHQFFLP